MVIQSGIAFLYSVLCRFPYFALPATLFSIRLNIAGQTMACEDLAKMLEFDSSRCSF